MMQKSIRFSVASFPPKKSGSNSMWGNPDELVKIERLRRAAAAAFPSGMLIEGTVTLSVWLYLPKNDRNTGDLDTYVAGICDALMALPARVSERSAAIQAGGGRHPLGFIDDSQVTEIHAYKVVRRGLPVRYEVALDGDWVSSPLIDRRVAPGTHAGPRMSPRVVTRAATPKAPTTGKRALWLQRSEDERRAARRREFSEAISKRLNQGQGRWGRFKTSLRAILDDAQVAKIIDSTLGYSEFAKTLERESLDKIASRIKLLEASIKLTSGGQFESNRRKH